MNQEPRILIIDDETHICECCDRIFTNAGYRVDTNIVGSNGYRQALVNDYDAIVLDLNLVESDGMKLLSGIRKRRPEVPVLIITGYPSEESRRMSSTLGASDYIIKPFGPEELLEPVQKLFSRDVSMTGHLVIAGEEKTVPHFRFYKTSWFQQQRNGLFRVGSHIAGVAGSDIKAVRLPLQGEVLYRGLPMAEVVLNDRKRLRIPSPVNGKISETNELIREYPYILKKDIRTKNWIATVESDHPEENYLATETRQVLIFAREAGEENEFLKQVANKGFVTRFTERIEEVLALLAKGETRVVLMDARNFPPSGPDAASRITDAFPDVRVIVINEPDMEMEKFYRTKKLFYYGIYPLTVTELSDILYCAFKSDVLPEMLVNPCPSRFLPDTVDNISIINRDGSRSCLLASDRILKNSHGLGYLVSKALHDLALPLKINHTQEGTTIGKMMGESFLKKEKELNDRVIILQTAEIGRIPGCIERKTECYKNGNASLSFIIHILIQPLPDRDDPVAFDENTTMALKNIILDEMIPSGKYTRNRSLVFNN